MLHHLNTRGSCSSQNLANLKLEKVARATLSGNALLIFYYRVLPLVTLLYWLKHLLLMLGRYWSITLLSGHLTSKVTFIPLRMHKDVLPSDYLVVAT